MKESLQGKPEINSWEFLHRASILVINTILAQWQLPQLVVNMGDSEVKIWINLVTNQVNSTNHMTPMLNHILCPLNLNLTNLQPRLRKRKKLNSKKRKVKRKRRSTTLLPLMIQMRIQMIVLMTLTQTNLLMKNPRKRRRRVLKRKNQNPKV